MRFIGCAILSPSPFVYAATSALIHWPGFAEQFPFMAPDKLPLVFAIDALQIEVMGLGLALICLAGASWLSELKQRRAQ